MNIKKYFWELNEEALKETTAILKNPKHPKFLLRMITLLSRCQKPKELFSLISQEQFIENWPKIKRYWQKMNPLPLDFRDWWQTIYESILEKYKYKIRKPKGKPFDLFIKIGRIIREKRIKQGLSQEELALRLGMRQPDISKIEEGKKNITLETLTRLCKTLNIKKIEF